MMWTYLCSTLNLVSEVRSIPRRRLFSSHGSDEKDSLLLPVESPSCSSRSSLPFNVDLIKFIVVLLNLSLSIPFAPRLLLFPIRLRRKTLFFDSLSDFSPFVARSRKTGQEEGRELRRQRSGVSERTEW